MFPPFILPLPDFMTNGHPAAGNRSGRQAHSESTLAGSLM